MNFLTGDSVAVGSESFSSFRCEIRNQVSDSNLKSLFLTGLASAYIA